MIQFKNLLRHAFLVCAWLAGLSPARAWDEQGHVIVTRLAWEKLPEDMPDWLRTPEARYRLEYLSAEPDRWRGQKNVHLEHFNNPNHYIDAEDLEAYGLTLLTLPPLRREFLDLMAERRALHPRDYPAYDRKKDRKYTKLVPGLLPYEIAEGYARLASSFTTLKTYEQYRDLVTDDMIENARQNVIYQMGIISHFVGDGAQPLHLTRHHNGWVGPNPKGYTRSGKIHSFIDGGVIALHDLTPDGMVPLARPPRRVTKTQYWRDICTYLQDSFEQMEPLYALEKSGKLREPEGKTFIEERLVSGGAMLCGIWVAARDAAVIDKFRADRLQEKAAEKKAAASTSNP